MAKKKKAIVQDISEEDLDKSIDALVAEEVQIVKENPDKLPLVERLLETIEGQQTAINDLLGRVATLEDLVPKGYDDGPMRLEMVQILTKRLPELWEKYIAYMNKTDMAQGRLKPDWPHFINWLKEYYG